MSVVINKSTRLCKITTGGPISILGGISGPITKCKLTNDQIITIMRSGHAVWEYNPKNSADVRQLTLDNNGASPFEEKPVAPDPAPKAPEKKPVAAKPAPAKKEAAEEPKPVEPVPAKDEEPAEEPVAKPVVEEVPVETPAQEPVQEETDNADSPAETPEETENADENADSETQDDSVEDDQEDDAAIETESAAAEEPKKSLEIPVASNPHANGGNNAGKKKKSGGKK